MAGGGCGGRQLALAVRRFEPARRCSGGGGSAPGTGGQVVSCPTSPAWRCAFARRARRHAGPRRSALRRAPCVPPTPPPVPVPRNSNQGCAAGPRGGLRLSRPVSPAWRGIRGECRTTRPVSSAWRGIRGECRTTRPVSPAWRGIRGECRTTRPVSPASRGATPVRRPVTSEPAVGAAGRRDQSIQPEAQRHRP
jgi:hypothetical protein